MKILNASLMADPAGNGYTKAMEKAATGGYWSIRPGEPDFNQRLLAMAREHRPDIIFIQVQADGIVSPHNMRELSSYGFVINWTGDIRAGVPQWMELIGRTIQLTTFSNMRDVNDCLKRRIPADWLEIGYDPEKYMPRLDSPPQRDICFMGNNYGPGYFEMSNFRMEAVNKLHYHFRERFGVGGTGWTMATWNLNHDQVEESKVYNGCKIGINISHFHAPKYSSDRLLRIMGSGCMALVHHFPQIEEMYTIGEHLDTFSTLDEMIDKCRYYLSHESERQKIAAAGQQFVRNNYTFDCMAQNIVKLYLKHKK